MIFFNKVRNVFLLAALCMSTYLNLAIGDDGVVEKMYTVKINNILLNRDVAETILLYMVGESINIRAYDNL
jgi:hypothetical protein